MREDILTRLKRLKKARQDREEAEARVRSLEMPERGDFSRISELYRRRPPYVSEAEWRKLFTIVVVMMYAPACLLGDPIPRGLRKEIEKAAGYRSGSAISRNLSIERFRYMNVRSERKKVDKIYDELTD